MRTRIAIFVLALAACAPSAGERVKSNVKEFNAEQSAKTLIERGRAFASVGDLTRAEQYFAAALDQGGDEKQILPLLLSVCAQDGRYRVAISYAESYLKKHPNDVHARFVLGTLHAAVGNAPEAKVELERVLVQNPGEAQAHFALATVIRDNQGDLTSADHHFREYLRLSPEGTHAEEARASLLKTVPLPAAAEKAAE